MNPRTILLLPIIIAGILGCNGTIDKMNKTVVDSSTLSRTEPLAENISVSVPSNVDDDFNTFLSHFNKDSVFQVSRISFPLKVKEADADFELKDHVIEKATFRKIDFTYDERKTNKEYEQTIKVERKKAVIEVRGIENGMLADYNFEKRNGKWVLVTWTDSST